MWQFEHTETTTASPHAVFERWGAVAEWPTQNPSVEWSKLEGPFALGSKIILKPMSGPKSTLEITEFTPDKSFTATGKIPAGSMRIEHSLEVEGGNTVFTHHIVIEGALSKIFAAFVGKNMAKVLPRMMAMIKTQAESAA